MSSERNTKTATHTLARVIDHTLLKADATESQIRQLCGEAQQHSFASVCVNPTWVALCAALLAGSPVRTCTVIGFPLGATLAEVKVAEAQAALRLGAQELDMVINIGRLKGGDEQTVAAEIAAVVAVAHSQGACLKVIIETALLSQAEKVTACLLAAAAGADFVKTSTGFAGGGATVEDVALMRRTVGHAVGVKASGGVRNALDAQRMVSAGATRIGTSAGVAIVQQVTSPPPEQEKPDSAASGRESA